MHSSPSSDPLELKRHAAFLRGVARALLGSTAEAEELSQDLLVHGGDPGAPRAFWNTVARRMVGKRRRAAERRSRRERVAAVKEAQPSTVEVLAREEILVRVAQAVASVRQPYREALLLRFYEDLPPRRMALRMGVPVATARSRVRRGIELLRSHLDSGGAESWRPALLAIFGSPSILETLALGVWTMKKILGLAALVLFTILGGVALRRGTLSNAPELQRERSALVPVDRPELEPTLATTPQDTTGVRSARAVVASPEKGPSRARTFREPQFVDLLVIDAGGRPVPGAILVVSRRGDGGEEEVGATDTEGRARFLVDISSGHWSFGAMAPGFARTPLVAAPLAGAGEFPPIVPGPPPTPPELVAIDDTVVPAPPLLRLHLLTGAGSFEGVVLDSVQQPVPDALVYLEAIDDLPVLWPEGPRIWNPMRRVGTGAEGTFRFDNVPPGPWRLGARAVGHADRERFVTSIAGESQNIDISLAPGLRLSGVVRDERGQPLAGATVGTGSERGPDRSALTGPDGSYSVVGLTPGAKVWATFTAVGRADRVLRPEPGVQHVRWDPVLESGLVLEGRLEDPAGRPLHGYVVRCVKDTWPVKNVTGSSGADGAFRFANLARGPLHLEVHSTFNGTLPLARVEDLRPDLEAVRPLVIVVDPRPSGSIRGKLAAPGPSLGLEALSGRTVHREPITAEVELAADRRSFALDDLPPGRFRLLAIRGLHMEVVAEFELAPGQSRDLGEVAVSPSATLVLDTSSADGTASVRWLLEQREAGLRLLEGRGRPSTELRVAPGSTTLQVELEPGALREYTLMLEAGQRTELVVDLDPRARVRLQVPPRARRVEVVEVDTGVTAFSGQAPGGEVELRLGPGRYRLGAELPEGSLERIVELPKPRDGQVLSLSQEGTDGD